MSKMSEDSYGRLRAWNEDLSLELSEKDWRDACSLAHTRSINIRIRLIQYKWLMRIYVTPVDLSRYDGNFPDVCPKCTETKEHGFIVCGTVEKLYSSGRQ